MFRLKRDTTYENRDVKNTASREASSAGNLYIYDFRLYDTLLTCAQNIQLQGYAFYYG